MSIENPLWVERYRPKTVNECILPVELKKTFQEFVNSGIIPNLLLTGRAGIGKTSIAKAMLDEINADYIVINSSMNGNIDTLRNDILQFASAMSFKGGRKYVILDEADHLNANSTQPALRNFIEEFSQNCGFIFTCNNKNRIIEPLHSRCSVIEFSIPKTEKTKIMVQFLKRTKEILKKEGVASDDKVVAELIAKYFPDWRRVIGELQRYSVSGKIDSGIFINLGDESVKALFEFMREKSFTNVRKWANDNFDIEPATLFRKIYDEAPNYVKTSSLPMMVLILADYQYKSAFVADQEINNVACATQLMSEIEWL